MSVKLKLTNNSGGLLVCDLAVEGKTLRLNNKQSKTILGTEMTRHLENLVSKGLLLKEEVVPEKPKKDTVKNNSKKEKEE